MPKEGSLYNFKVKSIEIYYNRSLTTTITQTSLFYFHITIWFFYAHEKGFCNTVIYIFYPVISCTPALLPSVLFQIISALTSLFSEANLPWYRFHATVCYCASDQAFLTAIPAEPPQKSWLLMSSTISVNAL